MTNACQGCLSRHCQNACPKDAIDIDRSGHACIDQSKCIKCGKCKDACSYQAIIKFTRPCQEACGMNAIGQDEYGHACIDYDKCVSCGMCLVNCPFGAIVDKGQLFQLIHAIRQGDEVVAVIAPAFWGQFGDNVTRPGCRVVFIGPCAAKKLEASRRSVRSDVDFVITFEELRGMFEAKNIDFSQIPDLPSHYEASAPGVGFAAGGGVAKAVKDVIHRLHPEMEVKTVAAEGLNQCRHMLRLARTGKYDGYLLEGMACPGGCIAGAGTVQPPEKSRRALERYKEAVSISNPMDSQYMEDIHLLYESDTDWGRVGRH